MVQPGEKLAESIINLKLPLRMNPVTLIGQVVKLVPFDIPRDAKQLFHMINGDPIEFDGKFFPSYDANELIWKYFLDGPFPTVESFENYLQKITSDEKNLLFCVKDIKTNTSVGMMGYGLHNPLNFRAMIRFVIGSPVIWGTVITIESMYLLLKHAFELGYRRIDARMLTFNYRSLLYFLKLGFKFEGRLQYLHIIKGKSFDAFLISMIDDEWKYRVKNLIEKRIRDAIKVNPKI
jgi:RimJ/RimL family protein N-acetyltransferase